MYTIGEFARMGQVSRRQLRHWDEIGLLQPAKVDPHSGYRYYSATQLTALNRIVALKELGLSLDQIQRFIDDDVSLDEMQGMLLLRKAEIEQQILAEMRRIRTIEARLKQIREHGTRVQDVIVKQVPARRYIGMRVTSPDWEATVEQWNAVTPLLANNAENRYGHFMGILHADGMTTDYFDMEVGRILRADSHPPISTHDGKPLETRELPPYEMATFIQKGAPYEVHIGFSAIGEWAEMHGYAFAGPMHGIILHPAQFQNVPDLIVEVQFPIQKRDASIDLLNSNNLSGKE
ncbi:MAG: MerR family transcriptional regulator [Chloroflexota bacterium]